MANKQDILRKILGGTLTVGATLSIGFLGFVGMYVLIKSLVLCGLSFILAAAYESQVNGEGIGAGLKRAFDPYYLGRGIAEQFLNDLMANQAKANKFSNNLFLKQYKKLLEQIEEHEANVAKLEKIKEAHLPFGAERKEAARLIHAEKRELKRRKRLLRERQLFLLRRLYVQRSQHYNDDQRTAGQKAMDELLAGEAEELRQEIRKKLWLISFSWIFLAGVGACAGLATLGAMQGGLVMCAESGIPFLVGLSATPFGLIVVLSVVAAIGYTVLMYQGVSDMIQEYKKHGQGYFKQRDGESSQQYYTRCFVAVTAILLSIFATIATAGTWWSLVKDGSVLLGAIDSAALALQVVFIGMMAIPNAIFNTQNSLKSADNILKSEYKKIPQNTWGNVKECFNEECGDRQYSDASPPSRAASHLRDFVRFVNPFRFVNAIYSTFIQKGGLFLGHVISIGVSSASDGTFPGILGAWIAPIVAAFNELLTDLNYLPKDLSDKEGHDHDGGHSHDHNHENIALKALFFPFKLISRVLRLAAAGWDCLFAPSGERDLKQSIKKMFTTPLPKPVPKDEEPTVNWENKLKTNATAVEMRTDETKLVSEHDAEKSRHTRRLSRLAGNLPRRNSMASTVSGVSTTSGVSTVSTVSSVSIASNQYGFGSNESAAENTKVGRSRYGFWSAPAQAVEQVDPKSRQLYQLHHLQDEDRTESLTKLMRWGQNRSYQNN